MCIHVYISVHSLGRLRLASALAAATTPVASSYSHFVQTLCVSHIVAVNAVVVSFLYTFWLNVRDGVFFSCF